MDPTLRSLDLNGKRENQVNSSAEIHEFHTEKDALFNQNSNMMWTNTPRLSENLWEILRGESYSVSMGS